MHQLGYQLNSVEEKENESSKMIVVCKPGQQGEQGVRRSSLGVKLVKLGRIEFEDR